MKSLDKQRLLFLYFFLTGWGIFWVFSFVRVALVQAQTIPNVNQLTFSSLSSVKVEGNLQLSNQTIQQLGFNPNRIWSEGQSASEIIQLGEISEGFQSEKFSLSEINPSGNLTNLTLQDYGVVQFQTVASLAEAIPSLNNQKVGDVVPVRDLIVDEYCDGDIEACRQILDSSFDSVINESELANLSLNQLPLGSYSLTSIPGLPETPIEQFNQWQEVFISEIPGLSDVPWSNFPNPLTVNGLPLAQVDIVFSDVEQDAKRTISGSDQEGFNKACSGGCSHIELAGNPVVLGKQWVSGYSQKVEGGHGVLKSLFGGKEPTGRHPFGSGFKVVIGNINEANGTVETELYFRICQPGLGCSPYGIGPFPFLTFKEKDWIFLGN